MFHKSVFSPVYPSPTGTFTSFIFFIFLTFNAFLSFSHANPRDLSSFYTNLSTQIESDAQFRKITVTVLKNALKTAEETPPVITPSTTSDVIQNWLINVGELARALKIASYVSNSTFSSSIRTSVRSSLADWSTYRNTLLSGIASRISTGLSEPEYLTLWSQSYRALPVSSGGLGERAFYTYDLEWDRILTATAELYIDFPNELSAPLKTLVKNRLTAELNMYVLASTCRYATPGVETPSNCNELNSYEVTPYVESYIQNHGFVLHASSLRAIDALITVDGGNPLTDKALLIAKYALNNSAASLSPDGSPIEGGSFGYFAGSLGIQTLLPSLELLKSLVPSTPEYLSTPSVQSIPYYLACAMYPDLMSSPNFGDAESSLSFGQNLVPSPWILRYLAAKTQKPELLWYLSELEKRIPSRFAANISTEDLLYHNSSLAIPNSPPEYTTHCYLPNRGLVFSRQNLSKDSTMVGFEAAHPLGDWLQQKFQGVNCLSSTDCRSNPGHGSANSGIFEIFSKGRVLATLPPYTTDKRTENYPGTVVALWNGTSHVEQPNLLETSRPDESLWNDTSSRYWGYYSRYYINNGDSHISQSDQKCFYGNTALGYTPCTEVTQKVQEDCQKSGGCSETNFDLTIAETGKSYVPTAGIDSYKHMFAYFRELDCVLRSESLTLNSSIPTIDQSTGNFNRVLYSRLTTIKPDPALAMSPLQKNNLYLIKAVGSGILLGDLTLSPGNYEIRSRTLQNAEDIQPGVRRPNSEEAIPRKDRIEFLRKIPVTGTKHSFLHLLCPAADNSFDNIKIKQTPLGDDAQEVTIQRGSVETKVIVSPQSEVITLSSWVGIPPTPTPTHTQTPTSTATGTPIPDSTQTPVPTNAPNIETPYTPTPTPTVSIPDNSKIKWKNTPKKRMAQTTDTITAQGEVKDSSIKVLRVTYYIDLKPKTLKFTKGKNKNLQFKLNIRVPKKTRSLYVVLESVSGGKTAPLWKGKIS